MDKSIDTARNERLISGTNGFVEQEKNRAGFTLGAASFLLRHCRPEVRLDGEDRSPDSWQLVRRTPDKVVLNAKNTAGNWQLTFTLTADRLTMRFGGTLKRSCRKIGLYYFRGVRTGADHLLGQGLKMGGCCSLLLNGSETREFTGYYQLLLTSRGTSLRLSYPLQSDHLASFAGRTGKKQVVGLQAGAEIRNYSGRKLELPPLCLRTGDGFELMREYAAENGGDSKRDFSELTAPGWNSWDYYRWTVTEDDVLENAEFIAHDPVLSRHVRRIIVDDGWQYAYGEWEANSLFPHGMKWLAGRIRKLGMEPGLWVAPNIIDLHSRIAQLHPEMLAQGESGAPAPSWEIMKRRVFLLDPTVESSQQFIRETFERLLSWGYGYFKLDFLGGLMFARKFADGLVGQGKLMDLTIGTAYRTVAGRAKLLGCNYLFNGGTEIADLVRVGSDIHARWNNIKLNAVSVAARFWTNKRLWVNDPDFALCRSLDTADDPEQTKLLPSIVFVDPDDPCPDQPPARFTLVGDDVRRPQMEVLLSIVLMAGGAVTLSDRMSRLNASGLDLARRVVSAESGEAAVPLDLFESALPSCWLQKLKRGFRVLLVNWDDRERERVFDLAPLGLAHCRAVNFWNYRKIRIKDGRIAAELAPRSCLLAEIG